jgi:hypothetical protein
VAVESCAPLLKDTVEGSTEQVAYATALSGAQVSATVPEYPLVGVTRNAYVALMPCATVTVALEAPFTVNRMPPPTEVVPAMPVPLSGTSKGDA